jgi:hypothetical protein
MIWGSGNYKYTHLFRSTVGAASAAKFKYIAAEATPTTAPTVRMAFDK